MWWRTRFRGAGLPLLGMLLAGIGLTEGAEPAVRVAALRCEYRDQPLGIDTPAPRLNWQLESSLGGQKQAAYRVLVARTSEALHLQVPVNTTAALILPAGAITENGRPASESKAVHRVPDQDSRAHFKLESGRYHFLLNLGLNKQPIR